MRDTTVRAATDADLEAAIAMGARFYETTSYQAIADYCPDSARLVGRILIEQGVLLVAERDGRLVGMVGLVVAPFMFNHRVRTAHEVMWWVDPDEREGGAGAALLRAIEPACRAKDVRAIQMLHLATSPPQAALLYRRLGFVHSESSYMKVL